MRSIWDQSVFCTPLLAAASLDALTTQGDDGEPVPITDYIPDPGVDVEGSYEAHETAAAVAAFVDALTPRAHQAVRRVFWDGETQAAVARNLGISGAAVTKLLAQVKASGRKTLANYRHSTLLS